MASCTRRFICNEAVRNIHEILQAKMLGKAHEYCAYKVHGLAVVSALVLGALGEWPHAYAQEAGEPQHDAQPADAVQAQQVDRVTVTGTAGERFYQNTRASTATKTDTLLIDTPQAITVVPREVIEDQGIRDIAGAVRNVSGLSRKSSFYGQQGNSFRIRGFALSDEHGYYKDGFRYNAIGTTVMNNVERVEVLKGPASVLYGRSEPGGIINLVSRQPSKQSEQTLEVTLGRWNSSNVAFGSTGALDAQGNVLYRLDASYDNADSFRDLVYNRTLSVAPTLIWQAGPQTKITVTAEGVWDKRRTDYGIPAYQGLPADVPINTYYGELFSIQESRQSRFALAVEHALSKDWLLKAQMADTRLSYPTFNDVYPSSVDDSTAQLLTTWSDSLDRYKNQFAQVDLIGKFSTGGITHTLLVGAEAGRQIKSIDQYEIGDYVAYDIFNPVRLGINAPQANLLVANIRLDARSQALYVQDQIDLGQRIKLLLGARYDRYTQDYLYEPLLAPEDESIYGARAQIVTKDSAISPRAGLVFKLTDDFSLYASASRSFAPLFPYEQAVQNRRFDPERGKLTEIGAKWDALQGKLSLTTAIYDLRKENVLTADPDNPQLFVQNGEEGSKGIELDIAAQLLRGLNVMASYAYNKARVLESADYPVGNTLPLAPRHSGSLWVNYAFAGGALSGWDIGAGAYYQGERFTSLDNDTVLPSYTQLDFALGYTQGPWKLRAYLKNATNQRIYESSNTSALIFPGAPRNFSVQVGYTF
jgi:iron complex outermembrane recepter protein